MTVQPEYEAYMDMRCGVSDVKSDKSLVDGAPWAYRIDYRRNRAAYNTRRYSN